MRAMKDSGAFYLGQINENWTLTKIGYCCKKLCRSFEASDEALICTNKGKVVPRGDTFVGLMTSEDNAMQGIRKGDIAIHGMDTWHGAIACSDYDGKITRVVHVCKAMGDNRFVVYWLQYLAFVGVYKLISNGVRGNTSDFRSWNKVANIYIPNPVKKEQQEIADYLDARCSEIDATTDDIQKEINILEEYKKSVITEAVTKGLDPNVEMKDSGIEWIGEIPREWKVDKIKYHLKRNEPKNPGNAVVLSVYRDYGVIPKDSRNDNHNVTSEDTSKYKYVKKGQLVINKMKAWQGSLAVSDYEGIVSPAYFIYDFVDGEYNHKYFHYLVRSCYKEEFKRISGGIREGQWDLSPEGFSNTLVLLPSIKEQNNILNYILQKENEIDALIADKKKQLELLAEYKKSLIYEYVTGKKEAPAQE